MNGFTLMFNREWEQCGGQGQFALRATSEDNLPELTNKAGPVKLVRVPIETIAVQFTHLPL
jgi:hypothetical protein